MKNRPATIKDIARKLRISVSTVSRALRNFPDVNADTKKAVIDMAANLEYEPNAIATSLVNKKSNIIGIVIPSFVIYYYATAITGIQKTAAQAGYNIMICPSDESYETEVNNIKALTLNRVDGLIVSISKETKNFDHFHQVIRKGRPLVFFNRVPENIPAPSVLVDDYDGAFQAVEHLIQTGSKRIAHIAGPETLQITKNRLNGYIDALKKYNHAIDEELICYGDFSINKGRDCTRQMLTFPNPPDAIFAVNDPSAFGAMLEIKARSLRIPEDVAVVGFTDEQPLTELVEPSLTSVSQPVFETGKIAAELFIKRIQTGITSAEPERIVLKASLIIRNSSAKNKR